MYPSNILACLNFRIWTPLHWEVEGISWKICPKCALKSKVELSEHFVWNTRWTTLYTYKLYTDYLNNIITYHERVFSTFNQIYIREKKTVHFFPTNILNDQKKLFNFSTDSKLVKTRLRKVCRLKHRRNFLSERCITRGKPRKTDHLTQGKRRVKGFASMLRNVDVACSASLIVE